MQEIKFLAIRWLLIIGLVLAGIATIPQGIEAGTIGDDATFTINNLVISPSEADTGQDVTISAAISNTSDTEGVYLATLKINGMVEEFKYVEVEPLTSNTLVTFTISKDKTGVYSVDLDGLSGTFTATEPSSSPVSIGLVVLGIVAIVVILVLFSFYLIKRRAA
ncbi:hypothetical protein ACFLYB_04960 [Chloroflexota bacterium]